MAAREKDATTEIGIELAPNAAERHPYRQRQVQSAIDAGTLEVYEAEDGRNRRPERWASSRSRMSAVSAMK